MSISTKLMWDVSSVTCPTHQLAHPLIRGSFVSTITSFSCQARQTQPGSLQNEAGSSTRCLGQPKSCPKSGCWDLGAAQFLPQMGQLFMGYLANYCPENWNTVFENSCFDVFFRHFQPCNFFVVFFRRFRSRFMSVPTSSFFVAFDVIFRRGRKWRKNDKVEIDGKRRWHRKTKKRHQMRRKKGCRNRRKTTSNSTKTSVSKATKETKTKRWCH